MGATELARLWAELWRRPPGVRSLWRHVKTGNLYEVVGKCVRESDLVPCVLYRQDGGVQWCRPLAEWHERFEPAPEPVTPEVGAAVRAGFDGTKCPACGQRATVSGGADWACDACGARGKRAELGKEA